MRDPNKPDPNLIKMPPETLFAILVAALLVPLLLTGFISQKGYFRKPFSASYSCWQWPFLFKGLTSKLLFARCYGKSIICCLFCKTSLRDVWDRLPVLSDRIVY